MSLLLAAVLVLAPCLYEDSDNCYWDASVQGNGEGRSFIVEDGVVTYYDDVVPVVEDDESASAVEKLLRIEINMPVSSADTTETHTISVGAVLRLTFAFSLAAVVWFGKFPGLR